MKYPQQEQSIDKEIPIPCITAVSEESLC